MSRSDDPLWADVRIGLEITEAGSGEPRAIELLTPFGIIGRSTHASVRIDNRAASSRHAYLHADARGLFFVDLNSRTGIRRDGNAIPHGWLKPEDSIEIAGALIKLSYLSLAGLPVAPAPCSINLLADSDNSKLRSLTLEPLGQNGLTLTIGPELVFVGRGDVCGIRLNHINVARTHSAILRTERHVYLIVFPGHPVRLNGEDVPETTLLNDASVIRVARTRFSVRLSPDNFNTANHVLPPMLPVPAELKHLPLFNTAPHENQPFPLELIPPESRDAVLGWMLGTLHTGQTEIIRRQNELQESIALILKQLQTETRAKLDNQDETLNTLKKEVARLNAKPPATHPQIMPPLPDLPSRPARDLPPAPEIDPARSLQSATWLLERIDKLGHDNKFSLKSLLSRLAPRENSPPFEDDSSMQSEAFSDQKPDIAETP